MKYPKTLGTVLHTHDFTGHRWIVKFYNEQGREVLGMDDVLAAETFHPEKYHLPKKYRTSNLLLGTEPPKTPLFH